MPRSSRLETHDHSTCGFMAWCRKSGAQVAGKLENSTAIVAADGEKSARIDLKVARLSACARARAQCPLRRYIGPTRQPPEETTYIKLNHFTTTAIRDQPPPRLPGAPSG